jgi:hypothetical protein
MFPSRNINDQALSATQLRARLHGLHRAAFWRKLGFPNCKLATAARLKKLAEKREEAELAQRQDVLAGAIENLKRR